VEDALFRITQEALNNALKHAKPASVVVTLRVEGETPDQHVVLEVVDDGVGFEADAAGETGGIGMVSMRERIEKLGGDLVIRSTPGKGTSVKAIVELSEEKHG
jgi:signal transduction histidine kinase